MFKLSTDATDSAMTNLAPLLAGSFPGYGHLHGRGQVGKSAAGSKYQRARCG
jgi:hypothetical protein